MAEAERIENSNLACLGAGVNPITSFTQGSAEAIFCDKWYELIARSELSIYKWRFATKTHVFTAPLSDVPDTKHNTAYQLPGDVLSVDTVMIGDVPINYDRYQDKIHTTDTGTDTVVVKYRYRADESLWNPYFQLLVVYRLATMLAFSIARKEDVAASMKGLADEHWRRAKTEDSQAQTNQKVKLTRLTRARGGRLQRFWRD